MDGNTTNQDTTSQFFEALINANNIDSFLQAYKTTMEFPSFHDYLMEICSRNGYIPEQVIRKSGIERTYGHQLFNGTRKPSRDKVIQLALGLQLDVEDTQKLLQIARKSALYPKFKRDAAILFCLLHQKDFYETQDILYQLGLSQLGDGS